MTAIPIKLMMKLFDVTGSEKSKMAASNLPKCISQLLHKISTKFQRLYLVFLVNYQTRIVTKLYDQAGRKRTWEIQDVGY